jgi:hypothetical protein
MDDEMLRQRVLDHRFPGGAFMFVWGELSEESEGYSALSQVLFDHESVSNPDDAPNRDLSDPAVRQGVLDCAMRYDDVRQACEKVICEITSDEN